MRLKLHGVTILPTPLEMLDATTGLLLSASLFLGLWVFALLTLEMLLERRGGGSTITVPFLLTGETSELAEPGTEAQSSPDRNSARQLN